MASTHATRLIRSAGRRLPHGWGDLGLQLAIFALIDVAYEASRTLATGDRATAMRHAHDIVGAERSLGLFHELALQRWAMHAPSIVMDVANWTYFNCQFTFSFGFVLWVYLRRNAFFPRLRNTLVAANLLGLVGYVLYPAAPPRMLSGLGFVDALNATSVNHHSGPIAALANPYAAMPSLHTAYACIVAVTGVAVTRNRARWLWLAYPGLVVFSIIATANHFVLDAAAGATVATLALTLVRVRAARRVALAVAAAGAAAFVGVRAAQVGGGAVDALGGAALLALAAAVAANVASVALKTAVWRRTLRAVPGGGRVGYRALVPAVFIGFLFNTVLVARLGEAAKVAVLDRRLRAQRTPLPASAVAGALAAEQVMMVAALAGVAAAVSLTGSGLPDWAAAPLAVTALAPLALVLGAHAPWTERALGRLPGAAGPATVSAVRHARAAFAGRDRGLIALGLSAASWVAQLAGIVWALQAFGMPSSLGAASAVFLASTLVGAVPLVPGNLGVFQAAVAGALAPFGVAAASAAGFALGLQAVEALLAVVAGSAFLAVEGLSFAAMRAQLRRAPAAAPVPAAAALVPAPAAAAPAPPRMARRRPADRTRPARRAVQVPPLRTRSLWYFSGAGGIRGMPAAVEACG